MGFGDCSGIDLPDIPSVHCASQPKQFDECCTLTVIGEEVLLNQVDSRSKYRRYHYWTILKADETPIAVCALEEFVETQPDWQGRRADYLAVGWHKGDCYLVIIELRRAMLSEDHFVNKLEQVQDSIRGVISYLLPTLSVSKLISHACHEPGAYKIVGVIVPSERSRKRALQSETLQINGYQAVVVSIPHSHIRDCRITWSELMRAIGL